jgi:hypothetical protein
MYNGVPLRKEPTMCLHAAIIPSSMCSVCTPPPPVIRFTSPAQAGARRESRTTSDFLIDAALIDALCEAVDKPVELRKLLMVDELPDFQAWNDPGCILFRPANGDAWERVFTVRLRLGGTKVLTTASRIAYAAAKAYRDSPLIAGQNAIHLCEEYRDDVRFCCVNPAHITGY